MSADPQCHPPGSGTHPGKDESESAVFMNGWVAQVDCGPPTWLCSASLSLGSFHSPVPKGWYWGQRTEGQDRLGLFDHPQQLHVNTGARGTQAGLCPAGASCSSLLPWDLVSRYRGFIPLVCPPCPRLSHITSPYLLPAALVAPASGDLFLSGSTARVPRPRAAPPRATAPSGLPRHWLRPGARVTAPRRAWRSPASWWCGLRRLRAETGWGRRRPPPDVAGALGRAVARAGGGRAPGRMGCTVSLVCCEALEPGPPCSPQPPGSPSAPAPPRCPEPWTSARAESRRLLLQVGRRARGWREGRAQLT